MASLPKLILSSCGTSLLTNGASEQERNLLTRIANTKEVKLLSDEEQKTIASLIDNRRELLTKANNEELKRSCAEINALLGFYNGSITKNKDHHYLLHTDTYIGEQGAILLQNWLKQKGINASLKTFAGLNTQNILDFQGAMPDLVKWAYEELTGYRDKKYEIIFSLNGGFKSVNGFLQAIGMFYADKIIYLFESSSEIMVIPRIPIDIELATTNIMEKNRELFRRLYCFGQIPKKDISSQIPETMLTTIDNSTSLSAWGMLLWSKERKALYSKAILPILSSKIELSEQFNKDTKGLAPDRYFYLNEQLDNLAKYLDTDRKQCPDSLSFKKLTGSPINGSNHEFYAWSDRDARRVYGHFKGKVFVLDSLGKHL